MEVTRNAPVPPVTRRGQKRKYPFNEMDPNDSISFEDDETFIKARRAARGHMNKHGGIFTSRKGYQVIGDEVTYVGTGGTIWRVE